MRTTRCGSSTRTTLLKLWGKSVHLPSSERPDYLYQKDRGPKHDFADDEELYVRIHPDHWHGDMPDLTAVRFPNTSVNRQKYSACQDVLYPPEGSNKDFCDYGIGSVTVADIPPPRVSCVDGREFTFKAFHDPSPDNYSHSEIRAFCDGKPHNKKSPARVKTYYRMHLRSRMQRRRLSIDGF